MIPKNHLFLSIVNGCSSIFFNTEIIDVGNESIFRVIRIGRIYLNKSMLSEEKTFLLW